jgi:putative phosphoribosyl transferase
MGGLLAGQLLAYTGSRTAVLLAIPPGGAAVAAAIAHRLNLPLQALPVRRLAAPGHPDVTLGAIAGANELATNPRLQRIYSVPPAAFEKIVAAEREALARREGRYRRGQPLDLKGLTAIVVDDAVVTGATMRAAIAAARAAGARRVIVTTPIMATSAYVEVRGEADAVVGQRMARTVPPLAEFYAEHRDVSESEALALLGGFPRSAQAAAPHAPHRQNSAAACFTP